MAQKGKNYYTRGSKYGSFTINSDLPTPCSDLHYEEIFNFPFISDEETVNYLRNHGRVMFIVRGPPGTRKHTLASIVMSKYPNSELCSADDYFSEPFVSGTRNRESLTRSHHYCEEKVLKACQENKHPIVIKNTHMKKWEMQYYINLAVEYCYVPIMVITLRKLSAAPEVLEKTNTQGLKQTYFRYRLRQWEEVVPLYTGWMLSSADAAYVTTESEKYLELLMEHEDFSKVFCTHAGDSPQKFFTNEYFPFCIAAYCGTGADPIAKEYYLSRNVQNMYGKAFPLTIQAYVITKSLTAAVVQLEEDMNLGIQNKTLTPPDACDFTSALSAMTLHGDVKPKHPITNFATNSVLTAAASKINAKEKIDVKNCSYMILSSSANGSLKYPYIKDISQFSDSLFSDITDTDGNISTTMFNDLDNGLKYFRLPYDSWLILPPEKTVVQSVFTGLYV